MIKFGTGGWRAIIGDEFTKANIQLLAKALCDKMKAEGKVKTVTYQQMLSRKMMYQNMLSLYEIYGLVQEKTT